MLEVNPAPTTTGGTAVDAAAHRNSRSEASSLMPEGSKSPRVLSIDALRGFDMFWIIGGDALARSILGLVKQPWAESLAGQWEHAEWEGFRFYDLIFPLFLFLVGCVLPYSMERYQGASFQAYGRILRRVALLFLLGLVNNGLLQFQWDNLRVAGVLQRIAICYGVAAVICLHFRVRAQVVILLAILLGYWAIIAWVPAPGGVPGDTTQAGNLAGYLDRTYLPGKILEMYYGDGDNEGLLSTLPAVATALIGVLAGHWLRSSATQWGKVAGLALSGTLCVLLGLLWSNAFPIIKNIWTSSFVLVAGGCSLILLAWFYALIDCLGWRRSAFFWCVIGSNAITIYVAQRFINFDYMAKFFFGGVMRLSDTYVLTGSDKIWLCFGILACKWVFLWMLYRQKLFLRV